MSGTVSSRLTARQGLTLRELLVDRSVEQLAGRLRTSPGGMRRTLDSLLRLELVKVVEASGDGPVLYRLSASGAQFVEAKFKERRNPWL